MTNQTKMVLCIIILAITNIIQSFEIRSLKKDDLLISDYVVDNYNSSVALDKLLLERIRKGESMDSLLVAVDQKVIKAFKAYHGKK